MKPILPCTQVTQDMAGQRLDNFLLKHLKGVPSSRIYRAIRGGEVRVNQKRRPCSYRLQIDDYLRVPPLRTQVRHPRMVPSPQLIAELENRILMEDNDLLIIDKPAGLPVHSDQHALGLIDIARTMRPDISGLNLVHRLDRETSGCLMLAKCRTALLHMHALLREHQLQKQYMALVHGHWQGGEQRVTEPLLKVSSAVGGCRVHCDAEGKPAVSIFRPLRYFQNATLVEVRLLTGRTHQARVHAAYLGYPIAGDGKYGNWKFNAAMARLGMKRLFLHASGLQFEMHHRTMGVCAILNSELLQCLKQIEQG